MLEDRSGHGKKMASSEATTSTPPLSKKNRSAERALRISKMGLQSVVVTEPSSSDNAAGATGSSRKVPLAPHNDGALHSPRTFSLSSASEGLRSAMILPVASVTAAASSSEYFADEASMVLAAVPDTDEEVTQHILYDGLPKIGPASIRAQHRQSEAYFNFKKRIHERVEVAHAMVLSANPLSLSVMASQLRMYRWRVTEVQTITDATAILQDYVLDTVKRGYRVCRRPVQQRGFSRYAHGRGQAVLKRKAREVFESLAAEASAAERRRDAPADAVMGDGLTATGARDTQEVEAEAETEEEEEEDVERGLPLPPPDALPRLVVVDAFTHEDLGDIARHFRFVDQEHGLEMLLVLLLPEDAIDSAASMQGTGRVVTPTHHITMDDAYAAGYDLVLSHCMDHRLVDFFTNAFVSSVGQWRNDVRSKAAVGNFMSLRNVLLGGLDPEALQRLAWDNRVDDAEVLEVLGAQSLSGQRYNEAKERNCGGGGGNGSPDGTAIPNLPVGVPRLRSRPASVAHFGVRLPAQHQVPYEPLSNFSGKNDVLAGLMAQSRDPHRRRGRHRDGKEGSCSMEGSVDEEDEYYNSEAQEAALQQRQLQGALEKELGRVLAENEARQASMEAMQEEMERLHRTVAVLRRHQSSTVGVIEAGIPSKPHERPDSGSMMHLTKQQQIFLLKERLDAANDRIVSLLREGRGSVTEPLASTRGARRGGSIARKPAGSSVSKSPKHPRSSIAVDRAADSRLKAVAWETEQMTSHDADANTSLTQVEMHRRQLQTAAMAEESTQAAAVLKQRKEREASEQVIHSLRQELRHLRGRLDDADGDGDRNAALGAQKRIADGLQSRVAAKLETALELLEQQKIRIRHLEELRQMDQLLLKTTLTSADQQGSGRRKKRSGRGEARSDSDDMREGGGHGGGGSGGGGGGSSDEEDGDNEDDNERGGSGQKRGAARHRRAARGSPVGDAAKKGGKKGMAAGAKMEASARAVNLNDSLEGAMRLSAKEAVNERIEMAVQEAVDAFELQHRRRMVTLVEACKKLLARVVLKSQRPCTDTYAALLREQLAKAKAQQQGAWARLRFTLSELGPDQYDVARVEQAAAAADVERQGSTDSEDPVVLIPLGAVLDANVRRNAAAIAREHAAYTLRIHYTTAELERVEKGGRGGLRRSLSPSPSQFTRLSIPASDILPSANIAADSDATLAHLLQAQQAAQMRVQEAIEMCAPVSAYLEAVLQKTIVEQQLRPWCDPNQASLFTFFQAVSPSSPLPSASATSAVLFPTTLRMGSSLSQSETAPSSDATQAPHAGDTLTDSQTVQLADVDARMEDVVELYATILRALAPPSAMSRARVADGACKPGSVSSAGSGGVSAARDPRGGGAARHRLKHNVGVTEETRQQSSSPVSERQTGTRSPQPPGKRRTSPQADSKAESESVLQQQPSCTQDSLTLQDAIDELPIEPRDVARYHGQLEQLHYAESAYSSAQKRLYELILRAYQKYRVNPAHMAVMERVVATTEPSGPKRQQKGGAVQPRYGGDIDAIEPGASGRAVPEAHIQAAYEQHREVLALLDLLSPSTSASMSVMTSGLRRIQPLLDREEQRLADPGQHDEILGTAPAFLSAVDTVLLGCIVDELRWRQWRRAAKRSGQIDNTTSPTSAEASSVDSTNCDALIRSLVLARTRNSVGGRPAAAVPSSSSDDEEEEGMEALRKVRYVKHYTAFCAALARSAGDQRTLDLPLRPGLRDSASPAGTSADVDDLFYLTDIPDMAPGDPRRYEKSMAYADVDDLDASRVVAHELAALFSKRRPQGDNLGDGGASAMLEDIYLDEEGGDGDDANAEEMRNIRRELEYLQAVKRQRMEELMVRFELQKGQRGGGNRNNNGIRHRGSVARSMGAHGSPNCTTLPAIDPERLDFEVKSGSPAWYGMEAAKRVHNILRRRARPDQIIVGGGPHGGGVGIELSRRTAQPAGQSSVGGASPSTLKEEAMGNISSDGYPSLSVIEDASFSNDLPRGKPEGTRAGSTRLPPLHQHSSPRRRGTAHWADDLVLGNGDRTRPGAMYALGDGANPLDDVGYVSPRDVVSLSAYGHLTDGGAHDYAGAGKPYCIPGGLASQVLAYRETLRRAAGSGRPAMNFASHPNGVPYCLSLSTPSSGRATDRYDAQGNRIPPPQPLPDLTSWIYGVPEVCASTLLQTQDVTKPPQPDDTVLFVPRQERSHLAELEERQRTRLASRVPQAPARGRGFLRRAMMGNASLFSTPAALAAQRLQAMLRVSVSDPTVTAAAAERHPSLAPPQAQGQPYPLHARHQEMGPAVPPPTSAPPPAETTRAPQEAVSGSAEVEHEPAMPVVPQEPQRRPLPRHESFLSDSSYRSPLADTIGPQRMWSPSPADNE